MKIIDFFKTKWIFFLLQSALLAFLLFVLSFFDVALSIKFLTAGCFLLLLFSSMLIEYFRKERYYRKLYGLLDGLEQKRFLVSFMEEADFVEGRILYDILKQCTKSMNDEVAAYKAANQDYRDYVETWIHEVKLPISCLNMVCQNHPGALAESILEETQKIDSYVEQALYYERSTNFEKDYIIHGVSLAKIVTSAVKKRSRQLIAAGCVPEFHLPDCKVYTDAKWIDFILGQLLANSLKYRREPFHISFSAECRENSIILKMEDNGIGIPKQDIPRIFEKNFTGENGRKYGKSTGIGLYLCKNLCEKMNLTIAAQSEEGKGTAFFITFPTIQKDG